uniref:Calponin-homology (CH) domain-containing protein n=1 Tax=Coccolithus braarudii TaxID=221442 RepID=A0A7S0Q439_9EUKA
MNEMSSSSNPPSRKELATWASQLLGHRVNQTIDKQFANGVAFCKLLDVIRPGSVELRKMNPKAIAESDAMNNFKVLQAALHKLYIYNAIDLTLLARGQPQETLALLQHLHGMHVGDGGALTQIDGNVAEGRGARKRRAEPPSAMGKREGTCRSFAHQSTPRPADAPVSAASPAGSAAVEAALRSQLDQARARERHLVAQVRALGEERDFYLVKLDLVEEACEARDCSQLPKRIRRILRCTEEEMQNGLGNSDYAHS